MASNPSLKSESQTKVPAQIQKRKGDFGLWAVHPHPQLLSMKEAFNKKTQRV